MSGTAEPGPAVLHAAGTDAHPGAALRGLPRGRWRGGAQRPPTGRPASVNQPRIREGVGGPTRAGRRDLPGRECEQGRAFPAARAAPGQNLQLTEKG